MRDCMIQGALRDEETYNAKYVPFDFDGVKIKDVDIISKDYFGVLLANETFYKIHYRAVYASDDGGTEEFFYGGDRDMSLVKKAKHVQHFYSRQIITTYAAICICLVEQ